MWATSLAVILSNTWGGCLGPSVCVWRSISGLRSVERTSLSGLCSSPHRETVRQREGGRETERREEGREEKGGEERRGERRREKKGRRWRGKRGEVEREKERWRGIQWQEEVQ